MRIGYQRDYKRMSFPQIQEALPAHIRVSSRHLRNLYPHYQGLLACADRLDVDKLKAAATEYGGLILSVDGLQPEGGQQGLWVAREVLSGTLLAAGWLPRDDETRLKEFLAPVKALELPFLATVSDKQRSLINALKIVWKDIPHQYCQAHYFSNAVSPLYDDDEHMKTQMRKQVRKTAGKTMREVLAQAKQKKSDGVPALIVTGLVVQPPEGLDEVKAAAQATIKRRAAIIDPSTDSKSATIAQTDPDEPVLSSSAVSKSVVSDALSVVSDASSVVSDALSIVSDASPVVSDASSVVSDASSVVSDTLSIVSDASSVVSDVSSVVSDALSVVSNALSVVNNALSVVSDASSVVNNALSVVSDASSVVSDTSSVVSDALSVVSNPLSVVSDASSVVSDTSSVVSDASSVISDTQSVVSDTLSVISDTSSIVSDSSSIVSDSLSIISDTSIVSSSVTADEAPLATDEVKRSIVPSSCEVRALLEGSGVVLYERNKPTVTASESQKEGPSAASKQEQIDGVVSAYAGRLRRVLSRSGRKPFRLAGLRLYADLLVLLGSLEVSLIYLPNESRLNCFADGIREALLTYESQYICIAEGYSWVLEISDILDVPQPEAEAKLPEVLLSSTVKSEVDAYLKQLSKRSDLNASLLSFRKHLTALTCRYQEGLYHCYDIPGLPRTNNDIESLFGRVRRQTLLTSGPHHAKQRLHEQGAWLLFDVICDEHEQLKRLQRVSLSDWCQERERMLAHQATFTADRSFRRDPEKYLAELEAQAASIAGVVNDG